MALATAPIFQYCRTLAGYTASTREIQILTLSSSCLHQSRVASYHLNESWSEHHNSVENGTANPNASTGADDVEMEASANGDDRDVDMQAPVNVDVTDMPPDDKPNDSA